MIRSVSESLTSGGAIARNTAWNFTGFALPMLVGVVTVPVLIHTLGTDRFAILAIAWMVVGYFGVFDFGLGRALTQVVAERLGSDRHDEVPSLFWTAMALMAVLGVAGGLVGAVLSAWLVHSFLRVPVSLQPETVHAFYLLAVSVPVDVTTAGLRGTLQAHGRFRVTGLIRAGMGLSTFVSPVLVLPFTHSLVAVVAALLVGRVVAWWVHLGFCLRVVPALRATVSVSRTAARSVLRIGGWITVSNVVSPLMSNLDRFLLGALVSLAAVTYYVTPFDTITKLAVIPSAVTGVVFPAFAASFKTDDAVAAQLFRKSLGAIVLVVFPISLTVMVFAREGLRLWVGPEIAAHSTHVLQWLAVGVLMNAAAQVPFAFVQGSGRPDLSGKLHLVELPLYLLALVLLVRSYGVDGAALAWTLRVTVDLVALLALSRGLLPEIARVGPGSFRVAVFAGAALVLAPVPGTWWAKTFFAGLVLCTYACWALPRVAALTRRCSREPIPSPSAAAEST